MKNTGAGSVLAAAIVAAVMGAGCVSIQPEVNEELWTAVDGIQTVGVAAARFDPERSYLNDPGQGADSPWALSGTRAAARATAIENLIDSAVTGCSFSQTLARYLVESGKVQTAKRFVLLPDAGPASAEQSCDYSMLPERDVDAVLEVAAARVWFERLGKGKDLIAMPCLSTRVRLIRRADGAELCTEWFDQAFALFRTDKPEADPDLESLQDSLRNNSEGIIVRLFLMDDFLASLPFELGFRISGISPFSPRSRVAAFSPSLIKVRTIDSLQPKITWAPFPNRFHLLADSQKRLSGIGEVSYDLRIWKVEANSSRKILAYERSGIPDTWHVLEQPLEPATKYFWRVRARMMMDGRCRVTRWDRLSLLNFMTPEAGK